MSARRQRPHRARRRHPRPCGSIAGVPVYDAHDVGMVEFIDQWSGASNDRLVVGIGPPGARPRAYLMLRDGGRQLFSDVIDVTDDVVRDAA